MKINIRKVYFTTGISIFALALSCILLYLFPVFRFPTPVLEFGKGSWYYSDIENNLKIELTSDGSIPIGVMIYNDEEFEVELLSKANTAFLYIKGENDSEFCCWLVGDCEIKTNGYIHISNAECMDIPFIDFKDGCIILKNKC